MIKLAVSGCCGKMGTRIISLGLKDKAFKLTAAIEVAAHPDIGKDVSGVKISDNTEAIKGSDVLIEFTSPEATLNNIKTCVKFSKPIVIGTTGLSNAQVLELEKASKKIPVVFSPNMSVGVNCLFALVKLAAKRLGLDYDVNIIEAHHVHKKDAPSGTAKKLAQTIEETSNKDVKNVKSIREDEIVGDHRVVFESEVDKIELFHSAKTRDIFAQGALVAAKFIVGKSPKIYSMEDVLMGSL